MTSLTIQYFQYFFWNNLNILVTSTVTFKLQRILKKIIMISKNDNTKILCHREKNCICICLKKAAHKVDPVDDP